MKMKSKNGSMLDLEISGSNCNHINVDTKVTISKTIELIFCYPLEREKSQTLLNLIGSVGKNLVEKIFQIEGILKVKITRYRLEIDFGRLFDQNQIIKEVTNIFLETLAPNSYVSVKSSKTDTENILLYTFIEK